jgi:hypothetical protein
VLQKHKFALLSIKIVEFHVVSFIGSAVRRRRFPSLTGAALTAAARCREQLVARIDKDADQLAVAGIQLL